METEAACLQCGKPLTTRKQVRFCDKRCSGKHAAQAQSRQVDNYHEREFSPEYIAAACAEIRKSWPPERLGRWPNGVDQCDS